MASGITFCTKLARNVTDGNPDAIILCNLPDFLTKTIMY